ncbi:MAG: adenylate kinase [Candidatus Micrarchaeota archaeon]
MIIVMGLPGAGKSTVLAVAESAGWKVINYGTMMMEIASGEYGVKYRDEIRKLSNDKQRQIQAKIGEKLSAENERNVILDTHCSVNTPTGYLPGLPFSFLPNISVERLVLVTAPIKDIMKRRKKDSSRTRDDQAEASLHEHDEINRAYLAAYSVITGAPAIILTNAEGKLKQTQEKFAKLLE